MTLKIAVTYYGQSSTTKNMLTLYKETAALAGIDLECCRQLKPKNGGVAPKTVTLMAFQWRGFLAFRRL